MPAGDWIALTAIGVTVFGALLRLSVRLGGLQQELEDLARRISVLERRMDNRRPRRYHG